MKNAALTKFGSLRKVIFDHVFESLIQHGGMRAKTAKYLGISHRTLSNYLKEMEGLGYDYEKKVKERDDNCYEGLATNQQRLNYKDYPHRAEYRNR